MDVLPSFPVLTGKACDPAGPQIGIIWTAVFVAAKTLIWDDASMLKCSPVIRCYFIPY